MMNHLTRHSKDDGKANERRPSRDVNQSDDKVQGSYYYDDGSNYEIYREDDEVDDSQHAERSDD